MKIVKKEEIFMLAKCEHNVSLWQFLENNDFLSTQEKNDYKNWLSNLNRTHHNDANFLENFLSIFTTNGKKQVILGQEDIAAVEYNNKKVIIRQSEMGVNISFFQEKDQKITKNEWKDYEKILNYLDLAFINAKDFHSLLDYDNINNELNKTQTIKQIKSKI